MHRGYIRLWRKINDCKILKEKGKVYSKLEAWIDICMNKARGIEENNLNRGEFEASYRYLAKSWNWSISKVQRFIKDLERGSEPMLKRVIHSSIHSPIHSGVKFIVCNYETYNSTRYTDEYSKRYTKRYKLNKGFNKVTNEGKDTSHVATSNLSPESIRLSEKLRDAIISRDPRCTSGSLPGTIQKWAVDIDKLLRIDKRTIGECESVIAWCQSNGCFWGPNILSGKKLREKFNTMWGQMNNNEKQAGLYNNQPDEWEKYKQEQLSDEKES